jgi:hypothetical protein
MIAPTNGLDRCDCGCKYWTTEGRCIDCGDRFFPDAPPAPSAFPELVPCSTCGHRWPANVLDNNNRCPICWDAKENPVTTTTRTTDNRWAAGSSGAVVPDDAPAAYGARWIDMGDSTPADVVPDRQGFAYTDRAAMTRLIDLLVDADKGIRSLAGLDRDAVEITNHGTTWSIARRRAGGYVYVEAWLAS